MTERPHHWNSVYQRNRPEEVSWYQPRPTISLQLIEASGIDRGRALIDVGGGASRLVDCLLEAGYTSVAVLDVAEEAIRAGRDRLGRVAARVDWIVCDVTAFRPSRCYALWHDRAVFHFLTEAADRRAYVAALRRALAPGGQAILATFALDGPQRCSGLPVMRHDENSLQRELGDGFLLQESRHEVHVTPGGKEQRFVYARFLRQRDRT